MNLQRSWEDGCASTVVTVKRERGELSNMYMGGRRRRTMGELTVEMGGLFVADGWSVSVSEIISTEMRDFSD